MSSSNINCVERQSYGSNAGNNPTIALGLAQNRTNAITITALTAVDRPSSSQSLSAEAQGNTSKALNLRRNAASFDWGPLIEKLLESAGNYLINYFTDPSKKNNEVRKKIGDLINTYVTSRGSLIRETQALIDLEREEPELTLIDLEQKPTACEDVSNYEIRYQKQLEKQFIAERAVRLAAAELVQELDDRHIDKYRRKGRITIQEASLFREINRDASALLNKTTDTVERTGQGILVSQSNSLYAPTYREFLSECDKFVALSSEIQSPHIPDEAKEAIKLQLEEVKGALDEKIKDLAELAPNSKWGAGTDWNSVQSNIASQMSYAQMFAQADGEIERNLRILARENPQKYLEQADLYQSKLVQLGRFQRAADFTIEWMNSIPAGTKWQDVEIMVKKLMYCGGLNRSELSGVSESLKNWLASQPISAEFTNERTLAQGTLGILENDMSLEGYQTYKICGALSPNEPCWKEMLALFDIETFQWDRAQKSLLGSKTTKNSLLGKVTKTVLWFPAETVATLELKIAKSQYKVYSFAFDAGIYLFSHYLKPAFQRSFNGTYRQALNVLDGGVQIASEPLVRDFVCTQLSDYPDALSEALRGNGYGPLLSQVSLACTVTKIALKPTLNLLVKDPMSRYQCQKYVERPISMGLDLTGMGARVLLPFQTGTELSTGTLASNLVVVLAPPALSMLENYVGDTIGHNSRALLRTANKIAANLPLVNLLYYGSGLVFSYGKRTLVQYGAEHIGIAAGRLYSNVKWITSPVILLGPITYGCIYDFPNIRAVTVLEEIRKQHATNNNNRIAELRNEAENWWVGNSDVITKYNNCLDFFKLFTPGSTSLDNHLANEINGLLPLVDEALQSLKPIDSYSLIRSDLLYHKIALFLSEDHPDNYAEARRILSEEKQTPYLYVKLIYLIFTRAEALAQENVDKAESFLEGVQGLFLDATCNNIVLKYKEYIAARRNSPKLTPQSSLDQINTWWNGINAIRVLVSRVPELSLVKEYIQSQMLAQYLDLKRYHKLPNALYLLGDASAYWQLLYLGFVQADSLARENIDDAEYFLEELERTFLNSPYSKVVSKYKAYISAQRNRPQLTANSSNEEVSAWLREIEDVRLLVKPISELAHVNEYIQSKIVNRCLDLKRYQDIARLLSDFGDRDAGAKYLAIKDFLENDSTAPSSPAIVTRMNALLPNVIQALGALKPLNKYSFIRDRLLYHTAVYLLSFTTAGPNEFTRNMLAQEDSNPRISRQLIDFAIEKAEALAQQNYTNAINYLRLVERVFPNPAYNNIIAQYITYMTYRQNTSLPTANSPLTAIQDWLTQIDAVRTGVNQVKDFEHFDKRLQLNKLHLLIDHAETLALQDKERAVQFLGGHERAFGDTAYDNIITTYKNYISCLRLHPRLSPESPEEAIASQTNSIDALIALTNDRERYGNMAQKFHLKKAILNIQLQKFDQVQEYLDRIPPNPAIQGQILSALALQAVILAEERGPGSGEIYLANAIQGLPRFAHTEIVHQIKAYFSYMQGDITLTDRAKAIDDLLARIQGIEQLSWFHENLLVSKFWVYMKAKEYEQGVAILNSAQISPNTRLQIKKDLSVNLIREGEILLAKENDLESTYRQVHTIAQSYNMLEDRIVKPYLQILANQIQCIQQPNNIEVIEGAIQAIDALPIGNGAVFALVLSRLKKIKIRCYLALGMLHLNKKLYQKALRAFTSAKTLLLTETVLDSDQIRSIDGMITLAQRNLTRV